MHNVSCCLANIPQPRCSNWMAASLAAIAGAAAAAALTLSVLLTLLVRFLMLQFRQSLDNSETTSSDRSAAGTKRGGGGSPPAAPQGARRFRIEELEQATQQFNQSSLIGCGTFGLVFKGLLRDGTVVAIKRREAAPRQEFAEEVAYLSAVHHRNLVALLGYCQERGCQMLVFEYLPNSSICNHLYDTGKDLTTRLEFKQRLSIAIGVAKGLCHLHGLQPPSVHTNFKTSKVLVDEDFIAKVADAGVLKLLEEADSSCSSSNAFRDPEFRAHHDTFQERSDVYSFGVFLLELISAKEAACTEAFRANDSIHQWVQDLVDLDEVIDKRLIGSFTDEGMRGVVQLMLKCIMFPGTERPRMENVVIELEQILENEITRTTVMGEGTAIALGSQLFTN